MAYADYAYYKNTYGGHLDAEAFLRFAPKASMYLEGLTLGQVKAPIPESAKGAMCAVCDFYAEYEGRAGISSESNDGYAVSYAGDSSEAGGAYSAAEPYLAGAGLLYRGLR